KFHAAFSAVDDPCIDKGRHVPVDSLHITADAPGHFTDRQRAMPGKGLDDSKTCGGKHAMHVLIAAKIESGLNVDRLTGKRPVAGGGEPAPNIAHSAQSNGKGLHANILSMSRSKAVKSASSVVNSND